jgi:predicted RNase H-like nuclease (RuvC/YqgF family)
MSFDPLQSSREALQAQHNLLSEKLLELRRQSAMEAGTSIKFQLTKQVAQAEAELDELAQRLDDLDRVATDDRLYQALLKLGYSRQVLTFRKFVQQYPVAAFLIYGKLDYGQRWLLNRLVVQHTDDSGGNCPTGAHI